MSPAGVRRVLLADDSALARRAVSTLLKREPGFEVVGEAEDGYGALALARDLRPDLVLMDINMPRCDGLLATRLLKRELPETTVVVLTVSGDAGDLFEAIRSGAQGYLLKSLDPESWLECLRGLASGEAMPKDLARRILTEFAARAAPADPDARLTEREREILNLVASAMTNKQVAEALYISEQTVKNHVKKIMQKLRLKNRVELALHARRVALGGP
ncbi:response regulator [Rubrobacter tropicus]|uniref:Response regulator n=1 Tax=Rubrobacter tropicus TaxID=2653851 RepID=A0A6G8Q4H6_9ACTN|nr:response regulator transcription factor [Rubrobacter tropicus]QIN81366.1 response regulator [Rubrobacter tropicus]